MTNRQRIFTFVVLLLTLIGGYFVQSSLWRSNCTQDLTCWYRIMPGLIELVDPINVLKNGHKVKALINKVDTISWRTYTRNTSELTIYSSIEELKVSDMIELFGEPSQVYVVQAFSPETNCAGLYVVYMDKGVTAYLIPEKDFVGIKPSQAISSLRLISSELLQTSEVTDVSQHEWQGFVDYCDLHNLTLPQPLRK